MKSNARNNSLCTFQLNCSSVGCFLMFWLVKNKYKLTCAFLCHSFSIVRFVYIDKHVYVLLLIYTHYHTSLSLS